MGKTGAKRTSETLPIPTYASKKQRTAKPAARPVPLLNDGSDSGTDEYEEAIDSVFVDELQTQKYEPKRIARKEGQVIKAGNRNVKGSRKEKGRGKKVADVDLRSDEYDDDTARLESQAFLDMVEFEARKKRAAAKAADNYVKRAKAKIIQDGTTLEKLLEDLDTEATNRDTSFISSFAATYAMSTPCDSESQTSQSKGKHHIVDKDTMPAFSTMYKRSQSLAARVYEIIESFEQASQLAGSVAGLGLLENEWEKEDELAGMILEVGRDVGIETHRQTISGTELERELGAGGVSGAVSKEQAEKLLFVGGGEVEDAEENGHLRGYEAMGWGRMARKQEKGVKKLVRGLSRGGEV